MIVDDQLVFRLGLRLFLRHHMPQIALVAEADLAAEGVRLATGTRPDLVLLDAALKDRPVPRVVADFRELLPHCQCVLLANTIDSRSLALSLEAGAQACLLKTARPEELLTALNEVLRGNMWIQPELAQRLYADMLRTTNEPVREAVPDTDLTPRQVDILRLIAEGLRNSDIAARLHISEHTVKTHVANILRKLGVSSRVAAARYAIQQRLVEN